MRLRCNFGVPQLKRFLVASLLTLPALANANIAAYSNSFDLSKEIGKYYSFLTVSLNSPIKLAIRTDHAAADSLYTGTNGTLPASSVSPIFSGFSVVLTSNDGAYNYTISAPTASDFISQAKGIYCPSHVCNYSYHTNTITQSYNNVARHYYQGASLYSVLTSVSWRSAEQRFYLDVRYKLTPNGTTYTFYGDIADHSCPPGYSFNSLSIPATCDLSDASVASQIGGDNVCLLTAGPIIEDKDCDALEAAGVLSTTATSGSGFVYTVRSSSGAIFALTSSPSGGSVVSRTMTVSDGSTYRDDTTFSAAGIVGATNRTHYPAAPPPVYPGDPGGTEIPSGEPGGTTTTIEQCGGINQPPCSFDVSELTAGAERTNALLTDANAQLSAIKAEIAAGRCGGAGQPPCEIAGLDSLQFAIDNLDLSVDLSSVSAGLDSVRAAIEAIPAPAPAPAACGAPGQPACAISFGGEGEGEALGGEFDHDPDTLLDPIKNRLSSFFEFSAPPHESRCPAIVIDVVVAGIEIKQTNNTMCGFLEQYRALLSMLAYLGFLASAIRVVLSA